MRKKISIQQLKPGMHVISTNRSWLQIPFFKRTIASMDVVRKLAEYRVSEVVIDTELGKDKEPDQPNTGTDEERFFDFQSLIHNIDRSKELHDRAMAQTGSMLESVRGGGEIADRQVEQNINPLVDRIMEDPQSILCVSVLKNTDQFTFGHCVNTAILGLYLGRYMGLSGDDLLQLGKGFLLHDIGKCMIPKEILTKAGPLTGEEQKIIQTHVKKGSNYLTKMKINHPIVLQIANQHHERVDGKGYPDGLKANEISWYGKLAALIDAYDAMTRSNYYKDSEDPGNVLNQLEEDVGCRYDADAFAKLSKCLGKYPPGSLLMLDTGEMAVVYQPNPQQPARPKVLLMTYSDGSFYSTPEPVDLCETLPGANIYRRQVVTTLDRKEAVFEPFEILERCHNKSR